MPKNRTENACVEPDSLQSAVGLVLGRALDDARVLESTGRAVHEMLLDASRREAASNLEERAMWLEALATHASMITTRLQFLAGRLSGLANGRLVIEDGTAGARGGSALARRS
jgi:hypothetical protein